MKRHAELSVGLSFPAMGAEAQQHEVGNPPDASNMKLLGWSDLQARSACQPAIHKQPEPNGDGRDPYNPKEVGDFSPAISDKTDKRCVKVDGADRCKTAIPANNVETAEC